MFAELRLLHVLIWVQHETYCRKQIVRKRQYSEVLRSCTRSCTLKGLQ